MRIMQLIVLYIIIILLTVASCSTSQTSSAVNQPGTSSQSPSSALTNTPTSQTQTFAPSTKTTIATQKASPVENINTFSAVKEGEFNRFYFLLENANGKIVTADGNVQLQIFDDLNNSLYQKQFDIKASEFVDYQFKLTGQSIGKAYEWRVPVADINKGISSLSWGRGVLTFTTSDGKKLTAESKTVHIPVYTDEELKQISETEYSKLAISVNQKISKGIFEVSVIAAGFFTSYEYGKKKDYFRVDMEVKNIGTKSEYFSPNGLVILDNQGNQYEHSYGGTLDIFSQIYPNITKKGYILFKGVPGTIESVKLDFKLGHDAQYEPYIFEYNIPLIK